MKHVILDTDIGGDPDDAFALLLALNSPEIVVDLIVTSDEHKGHRAIFARKLLEMYGKSVPVVCGIDLGNHLCCVVDDLVETEESTDYLSAIRAVVEKNEETYYVCIGPQSNLAAFIQSAPELAQKLHVFIMGGSINYRKPEKAEHNIRYDVPAALFIFSHEVKKHYVISETTFNPAIQISTEHQFYRSLSGEGWKEYLRKSVDAFFQKLFPSSYMHDPLTLSCVIKPGFVRFAQVHLEMHEDGRFSASEKGRPTTVSTAADYAGFMQFLGERLPL